MNKNKPESNFFYVNRTLLNSDRWLSEKFTRGQAWVDLFGLAQYKKGFYRIRGIKIDVERGQLAYSQITLSKRWKWSRGKVNRYLKELENNNDISLKTIQQTRQQIKFVTTLITLLKYDKWQGNDTANKTASDTANGQQTDSKQDIYKKVKKVKNVKNDKKLSFSELLDKYPNFKSFYQQYPKKKDGRTALKAFQKLNPNPSLLRAILKDIERKKKSDQWQKDSGQYIQHPATYLNKRSWEDEDESESLKKKIYGY